MDPDERSSIDATVGKANTVSQIETSQLYNSESRRVPVACFVVTRKHPKTKYLLGGTCRWDHTVDSGAAGFGC